MVTNECALNVFSAAIAIDHHCNYTAEGGVRCQFRTEPEVTIEHYDIIRKLNNYAGGTLSSDILYSFSMTSVVVRLPQEKLLVIPELLFSGLYLSPAS